VLPFDFRAFERDLSARAPTQRARGHFIAIPERSGQEISDHFAVGTPEAMYEYAAPPLPFTRDCCEVRRVGEVERALRDKEREVVAGEARLSQLAAEVGKEKEAVSTLRSRLEGVESQEAAALRRAEASEATLARLRAELESQRASQVSDLERMAAESARLLKLERESWQKVVDGAEEAARRAGEASDAALAKARADMEALRCAHEGELALERKVGERAGREGEARAGRRVAELEGLVRDRERECESLEAKLAESSHQTAKERASVATLTSKLAALEGQEAAALRRVEAGEAALTRLRAETEGLKAAQTADLERVAAEGARQLKLERES